MIYTVLDIFTIGNNTSVTVEGSGNGLKNNMIVTSAEGIQHELLSVAMVSGQPPSERRKTTTVLIKGKFNSETISITDKRVIQATPQKGE